MFSFLKLGVEHCYYKWRNHPVGPNTPKSLILRYRINNFPFDSFVWVNYKCFCSASTKNKYFDFPKTILAIFFLFLVLRPFCYGNSVPRLYISSQVLTFFGYIFFNLRETFSNIWLLIYTDAKFIYSAVLAVISGCLQFI